MLLPPLHENTVLGLFELSPTACMDRTACAIGMGHDAMHDHAIHALDGDLGELPGMVERSMQFLTL